MQSRAIELLVGFFVCLGIAAIFALTYRVSNLSAAGGGGGYTVTAAFNNIGSLKQGAAVNMAGVRIGRESQIKLDPHTFQAVVTMRIQHKYPIPKDSGASILTSGLLGEQYIGVDPGGSLKNMHNGDKFIITQSAIILENLIGKFMTTMAGKSGDSHHHGGGS